MELQRESSGRRSPTHVAALITDGGCELRKECSGLQKIEKARKQNLLAPPGKNTRLLTTGLWATEPTSDS